jgi:hypothetical protein
MNIEQDFSINCFLPGRRFSAASPGRLCRDDQAHERQTSRSHAAIARAARARKFLIF